MVQFDANGNVADQKTVRSAEEEAALDDSWIALDDLGPYAKDELGPVMGKKTESLHALPRDAANTSTPAETKQVGGHTYVKVPGGWKRQ
jgi:hypothetical protein